MYIKSIKLENFRTFYGTNNIEFSKNSAKPVTILIGENGAGKTNLLNAVFWAFTGGFTKQFNKDDPVINKTAYLEGKKSCSIEVDFSNGNDNFLLKRSYINQSNSDISLSKYNSYGALEPQSNELAKILIEKFIPINLASWFFFDGEAIGELHLDGRTRFRNDIRQTFGFSSLERLMTTLTDIEKDYRKEESRISKNDQLDGINIQLELLEIEQNQLLTQQEIHKENIYQKENIKSSLEKRLNQYVQAEPIQARREIAEKKLKEVKKRRDQKQLSRNDFFIQHLPKVLLKDKLEILISTLNQKEEDQSLPEPFGTKLIEQIKILNKCICGTIVLPGSKEELALDKVGERASTSLLLQKIFAFRSEVGEYKKEADKFDINLSQYFEEIGRCENEIAEQELIIRKADQDINDINDEEIKKIKQELTNADNILRENERGLGSVKSQLDFVKKNS
jgi:DNA sulfur modification protein DndD